METILMDNGLFAVENNILPQLFPDEKRKKMASLFMLLYSEAHKDTELVQGVKKTDLSKGTIYQLTHNFRQFFIENRLIF